MSLDKNEKHIDTAKTANTAKTAKSANTIKNIKTATTADTTQLLTHPFEPLFDAESRILILGSFPSVKSREQNFFYGHPQNRFWKVLAHVFADTANVNVPSTIPEKREFLLSHHVALWDVINSCRIRGSSDASIRDAVPTDLRRILDHSKVDRIFVNGQTAYKLYQKHQQNQIEMAGIPAMVLQSTSPANAAWSLERLTEAWKVILQE